MASSAESLIAPLRHSSFVFHTEISTEEDAHISELPTSLNGSGGILEVLSENSDDPNEEKPFADLSDFMDFSGALIRSVVAGDLSRDECLLRLKPHLDAYPGLASLIIDQIQVSEYFTTESENATTMERYSDLVNQLVARNFVLGVEVRERLDQEMLLAIGVADKGSSWDTRYVRTKTKWFFKLQKFNLYREESEGFTELIEVLDQASVANSNLILEKILELAGTYDMDIYRIVETMLTAICLQPNVLTRLLLQFCDSLDFEMSTLIGLIGAKFQLHGKKNGCSFRRIRGLCQLVCHIVAEGRSSWEDILPFIPFSKEESEKNWNEMFQNAVLEEKVLHTNKRSVKEQFNSGKSLSFDSMIQYFEENRNARIELVTTMLQRGMYHDAIRLINDMPIQYATTFEPLALQIAKIVHYIIDPLYRNIGLDAQRIPEVETNFPSVLNDQLPPQLTDAVQIAERLDPWLMLLGGNIIYDRILFTKLIRIADVFVRRNEVAINKDITLLSSDSQKVFRELLHIFEHCFLPGLTRGSGSSALSEKIFSVMKMLPYTIRFTLYYKMKSDFYPHGHPLGIVARAVALSNAKWFQKRINKDNTKLCGRMVAKDMYNNAIVVCNYLAERIGAYDNFGTLVTEAMRSASAFAADVMLYCILEYMTLPKNNSQKHDAMTIMPWYRYTATFSAIFAKRTTIELEPILEYVVGMLKAGQTVDLLILKELVHKLSGIEVSEGVTDEQLEALAGGEVLKAEGAYFSPMRNTKRSSVRLKEALLRSGQALNLCLLISHVESVILYKEDEGKNLKLVGLLYDMCHDTLVQYGTFLATNLSKLEYAENFPTLAALIRTYNIPFETSIFLLRSVYWNEISTEIENFKKQEGIPDGTLNDDHFKMVQSKFSKTFDNVISSVVELIAPAMTQAPMEDISLRFYVLFWFLSLYDLYVPVAVYEQEVEKLQQVVALASADQGDDDINTVYKRKKEGQRAQTVITRLQEEMSVQKQHVQMLRNHLSEEKDRWFQSAKSNKSDVVSQFLQMCVLPRATFSTIDALFSAHFISSLHELRTQHFSTLLCYDRMLCDITTALTCCSENEASRYGRLLHTVLRTIMRWHNNKATFEAECQHHPGFMTKFRTPTVSSGADVVDHIDYENFRHVCHKWHFKLTKSMVKSLDSDSYVRIRNGLIVLDRVLPFYPIISNFYVAIEKRVQQLMDSEKVKRPDMYSLAYGYMGRLRTQKAAGHLVLEDSFHTRSDKTTGSKKSDAVKQEKVDVKEEKSQMEENSSQNFQETFSFNNSENDSSTNKKGEATTATTTATATATTATATATTEKDVASQSKRQRISSQNTKAPVEGPFLNGFGGVPTGGVPTGGAPTNGVKNDKLAVAKEQADRVARRMEKNGIKSEPTAREGKSTASPALTEPPLFSSRQAPPPGKGSEKESKNRERKHENRSPDGAKVGSSHKTVGSVGSALSELKEKDRGRLDSPSQSPASRRSDDHHRGKEKERSSKRETVRSPLAGLSPDRTAASKPTDKSKDRQHGRSQTGPEGRTAGLSPDRTAGSKPSDKSKDRHHRQRSIVEKILSPETGSSHHHSSRKTAPSGNDSVGRGKEKEKGDRMRSPETSTGRRGTSTGEERWKEPGTSTGEERWKEPVLSVSSSSSHRKSVHRSRESSPREKKLERSHSELGKTTSDGGGGGAGAGAGAGAGGVDVVRSSKRRRDADSAERDRSRRKSSTAH